MNQEEQETIAQNEALSDDEKLRRTKEAKGVTWRDDWKPYGFRCPQYGNKIGFNLTRLKESPLNRK